MGALGLGFLIGASVEVFIDAEQIRKLNHTIDRLKLENKALMERKTEVIEIYDKWNVNAEEPKEVSFPNTNGF